MMGQEYFQNANSPNINKMRQLNISNLFGKNDGDHIMRICSGIHEMDDFLRQVTVDLNPPKYKESDHRVKMPQEFGANNYSLKNLNSLQQTQSKTGAQYYGDAPHNTALKSFIYDQPPLTLNKNESEMTNKQKQNTINQMMQQPNMQPLDAFPQQSSLFKNSLYEPKQDSFLADLPSHNPQNSILAGTNLLYSRHFTNNKFVLPSSNANKDNSLFQLNPNSQKDLFSSKTFTQNPLSSKPDQGSQKQPQYHKKFINLFDTKKKE